MLEIEVKYLVDYLPDLPNNSFDEIIQCYLSFEPEIRIRKKGEKFYLTKKGEGTSVRNEIETEIDRIAYKILLSFAQSNIIEKKRYIMPLADGLTAELDIYSGKLSNLMTVEVEFLSEDKMNGFNPPNWFGQDITFDKRYKNKNLARISKEELIDLIGTNNNPTLKKKK